MPIIVYNQMFTYETKLSLESIDNVEGVWWDINNNPLTHPMIHIYLSFTCCVANTVGIKNV